ncbi:cs domain-containing protein [Diplodia corticola]|uniref:Cs domain-containing protein n=1 Tax=Diplodia corticola TaxID=236234 RepID=A0A1J9QKQ9_9PEZI|nr:cs domain-containing protein [Diplodia corticola]OJD29057.1 cs domain-containing protein [Diplodia corticola]
MATRLTPGVLWAQRSCYSPDSNYVFLTIAIHDVPRRSLELDVQERKVVLDAHSDLSDTEYHLELNLHDDVYPNEAEIRHTDRQLELKLFKAEPDYWWPALLSDADVPSYVKQDFERWVNKDEQDGEPDPLDELVADMDIDTLQATADAALTSLPGFENIVTYTERQSGVHRAAEAMGQQDTEKDTKFEDESDDESDDEDDEVTSDDETSDSHEDSDSSDEDSPSPGSGSANGHATGHAFSDGEGSGGDKSSLDDSAHQSKGSSHGSGPSTSDSTDKEHSHHLGEKGPNTTSANKSKDLPQSSSQPSITPAGNLAKGTQARRELPFNLRPLSFEAWKKSVDRSVEISNIKHSRLMQLPKFVRLDIFEVALAVTPGNRIQFFPDLVMKWGERYAYLLLVGVHESNYSGIVNMKAEIRKAKNEHHTHYYQGDDMYRCGAPALLYVSKQVSEEACVVLYRRNHFAFRDISGFVAPRMLPSYDWSLQCQPTSQAGSSRPSLSAKTFGLQAATPHKDSIKGSFEACINMLAERGTLKELNLIIARDEIKAWSLDDDERMEKLPRNMRMVLAKRLSMEDYMFKHVLAKIPKLVTTVVVEESLHDPNHREEDEWEGQKADFEAYLAAIERKCQRYGFRYERRNPKDVVRLSHRFWGLCSMHLSEGLSLDNLTDEDLVNLYSREIERIKLA